jgi:hypothetical protein
MTAAQNKAFNVLKEMRTMIGNWKANREVREARRSADIGFFEGKLKDLQSKRKSTLNSIRSLIQEEFKEETAMQALLEKKEEQDGKFEKEEEGDDKKLKVVEDVQGVDAHEASLANLEKWMSTLSAKDRALMKRLTKKAKIMVEQELHRAALRKMEREEAAWYSCAFILSAPTNQCVDFPPRYNGVQREGNINADELSRVCNTVKGIVDAAGSKPAPGSSKALYLSWCVNSVKL